MSSAFVYRKDLGDQFQSYSEVHNPIIKVVSCEQATLFLTNNGTVYSIGSNHNGQSGLPEVTSHVDVPTTVPISNVIDIHCAENQSMFLTNKYDLYSCGSNHHQSLGLKERRNVFEPQLVHPILFDNNKIILFAIAYSFSVVITEGKLLYLLGQK
jgi:alpha-tubulin suppressor-like RCC1 family protein